MTIKEKIGKLAQINSASKLINLGDELRSERSEIIDFLYQNGIIELSEKGGFNFIGERADEYRNLYLDYFNNF